MEGFTDQTGTLFGLVLAMGGALVWGFRAVVSKMTEERDESSRHLEQMIAQSNRALDKLGEAVDAFHKARQLDKEVQQRLVATQDGILRRIEEIERRAERRRDRQGVAMNGIREELLALQASIADQLEPEDVATATRVLERYGELLVRRTAGEAVDDQLATVAAAAEQIKVGVEGNLAQHAQARAQSFFAGVLRSLILG